LNYNNKLIFYIPIFIVLLVIYRISWLPAATSITQFINLIILFLTLIIILLIFDFTILRIKVRFFDLKILFFSMIIFILSYSILVYNTQEITRFSYFIRLMAFIFVFFIFFVLLPKFLMLRKEFLLKFVKFTFLLGTFFSGFGVLFILININPITKFSGFTISFIKHPNYVSSLYMVTILTTLFYFFWQKNVFSGFKKLFVLLSLLVQIYALLYYI